MTMDSRESKDFGTSAPIEEELEFHFAEAVESLVKRGWTEDAGSIRGCR